MPSLMKIHNILKTDLSSPSMLGENHVDIVYQDKATYEQHLNTLMLSRRTETMIEAIAQSILSDRT